MRGVSKAFTVRGETRSAIESIDARVAAGSFMSVIGPSGCGKSTMLRIIADLLPADAGTVTADGTPTSELRRRGEIGFVPQSPALLPWATARDNVMALQRLGPRSNGLDADAARNWLARVGLDPEDADKLPHQLSGGMQQRVALARAFALAPSLLLMDEPFASLDELTRATVRDTLADLWASAGTTVVFITHSIEEAVLLADRVMVMGGHPGRVLAEVDIPLARPRPHTVVDDTEFRSLTASVRRALATSVGP
jgi:NitT/TauT family transport system ATP-binding protein